MELTGWLWLFFIFMAIQPVLRQRMLNASRLRLMRRLEQRRQSLVIALIHRQETMSLLGFPLMRLITVDDSEQVLRAIRLCDDQTPIDLILHTPGGLVLAASQIARALSQHPGKVTVFVPHYAMSGGTLIALAADEIVIDLNGALGPVDPQLGPSPAASVLTVLERKEAKDIDDQTLILADMAQKALTQVRALVCELLVKHRSQDQAEALADKLATGTWTHDYAITPHEARDMGLPVSTDMPREIYEFMQLFPQPTRIRPSVEYIPLPHRERQERTWVSA
jgi:ClpP class serine protease